MSDIYVEASSPLTISKKKASLYLFDRVIYILLFPAVNYMFKVNNRNTLTRCEICEIVNFEHISHLVIVFLLLTLSR